MAKQVLEPEEVMKKKMEKMRIDRGDIYDVLGHLVREFSLGEVADQLKTYLQDQTEQAFNQVEDLADGSGLRGLAHARAFDVCTALVEGLVDKAKDYDL